jgi:hypothetical protein
MSQMFSIQVQPEDAYLLDEILNEPSLDAKIVTKKNFNGQTELIDLFCNATLMSIPFIARAVFLGIKSRKDVNIKYNGIKIQGLSQENATEILKKLIDKK